MEKCAHCPVPPDRRCVVQTTRHARHCRWADPSDPLFDPAGREWLAGASLGAPDPGDVGASPDRAAALARIAACPLRGAVLPVSMQPECGCAELTECRAGKGSTPGRVTTLDCLECVSAGLPSEETAP